MKDIVQEQLLCKQGLPINQIGKVYTNEWT